MRFLMAIIALLGLVCGVSDKEIVYLEFIIIPEEYYSNDWARNGPRADLFDPEIYPVGHLGQYQNGMKVKGWAVPTLAAFPYNWEPCFAHKEGAIAGFWLYTALPASWHWGTHAMFIPAKD